MAAAQQLNLKNIPIYLTGALGIPVSILNNFLAREVPTQIEEVPSMMDCFQQLILKERGLLVVEIKDQASLLWFSKFFQNAVQHLQFSDIKIIVISPLKEVLQNRFLTQFLFIRTISPVFEVEKMGRILLHEYRNLETRLLRKSRQIHIKDSEIIIIKGTPLNEKASLVTAGKNDSNRSPMQNCIGSEVPSFLYDSGCTWRVRGHFTTFNEKSSTIIFRSDDGAGSDKLNEFLKSTTYLLSSSSSPQSRICTTLDYLGKKDNDFIFKAPTMIHEIQRRTDQRLRVGEDEPLLVQFFDPIQTTEVALSILDISAGGLSIRVDKDLIERYKAGQMIGFFSIIFPRRIVKVPAVEIRHSSRSDVNPDFKVIGLQFHQLNLQDKLFIDMFVLSRITTTGQEA
jgi:hypothetical protein